MNYSATASKAVSVAKALHGAELIDALAEWLRKHRKVPTPFLQQTAQLAAENGEDFARLLSKLGGVAERDLADGLAQLTGAPLVEKSSFPETALFTEALSSRFLLENLAIPIAASARSVSVAMAFPHDAFVRDALRLALDLEIEVFTSPASEIAAAIERLYPGVVAGYADLETELAAETDHGTDLDHLRLLASEAPVVRYVTFLFNRAVEMQASDIHLEPFEHEIRVRYRLDGVLIAGEAPPVSSAEAVVSRVKLLAGLDIAERRLPQDGRIMMRLQGKDVDMRVSTLPVAFGESLVVRLLDKAAVVLDLMELGFDERTRALVDECLLQPHGIFLVTGPTGSGKTTTLYAALAKLNNVGRKIISVEDPVEYQLLGVNQVPVKSAIGLTFAKALRAIVRQDPDVILIGETRDTETARIAVQSSLTGHFVLSTLHTNNAGSSITRLLDIGVEPYLLASTVRAILAQRLVRKLCRWCREETSAPELWPSQTSSDAHRSAASGNTFYQPTGCPECRQTGFSGRSVIAEYLRISAVIRQMVLARADGVAIQEAGRREGMDLMMEDGRRKAGRGITSWAEVLRATQDAE